MNRRTDQIWLARIQDLRAPTAQMTQIDRPEANDPLNSSLGTRNSELP